MTDNDLIGRLLKEARERKGASLRAAAGQLGVDPSHLYRVESGAKLPSPHLQQAASDYYGISTQELALASGQIPADIVEILRRNPQLLEVIRGYAE